MKKKPSILETENPLSATTRRKFIRSTGKTTLAVLMAAGALKPEFQLYADDYYSDYNANSW